MCVVQQISARCLSCLAFFELLFYLAIEGYYLLNVDGWQQNKFSFAELALTFLALAS